MQLQTIRNEFIIKTIETIKRKYEVIEKSKLQYYKIQPAAYLQELRKGYPEKPIFFVNFYAQSLLFVNENYIGGDLRDILYCPLVFLGERHPREAGDSKQNEIQNFNATPQGYQKSMKMDYFFRTINGRTTKSTQRCIIWTLPWKNLYSTLG